MTDDTIHVSNITGVDIELPVAGVGGRSYAFVIDWHIRILLSLAWFLAVGGLISLLRRNTGVETDWMDLWLMWLPGTLIYLLYHPVLELLMSGQTPGKRMAGVRIVTQSGATPDIGAILIRNIFRLVDSLPVLYVVGLIAAFATRNQVRLGDLAAGTVLVYHKVRRQGDLDAVEQLGRTNGLDLRRTALIQELLERWPQLQPEVRQRLALKTLQSVGQTAAGSQSDEALRESLVSMLDLQEKSAEQA